jgi:hypothetical protein
VYDFTPITGECAKSCASLCTNPAGQAKVAAQLIIYRSKLEASNNFGLPSSTIMHQKIVIKPSAHIQTGCLDLQREISSPGPIPLK